MIETWKTKATMPFPIESLLEVDTSGGPILTVVIDTEEEFDWSAPFDVGARCVRNIAEQSLSQKIFDGYGLIPTYVIDHPVATTPTSRDVLLRIAEDGRCEIGAHLHPWVSPPYEGTIDVFHSYPGNLPAELERRKLEALTQAIFDGFGRRPVIYKAGRYGIGPATSQILQDLGYRIDCSVVPYTDFSHQHGPDFSACGPEPFRVGPSLVELPLTVAFAGRLARHGAGLYPALSGSWSKRLHLRGIMARLGILERIRLSPEGHSLDDMKRLTHAALANGQRFFMLTYHSSSLLPGATEYVRDTEDRRAFLNTLDRYIHFFLRDCCGEVGKISEIGLFAESTSR